MKFILIFLHNPAERKPTNKQTNKGKNITSITQITTTCHKMWSENTNSDKSKMSTKSDPGFESGIPDRMSAGLHRKCCGFITLLRLVGISHFASFVTVGR